MQQAQFVFIAIASILQLSIALHGSITTYVEQQYHNFTESKSILGKVFAQGYASVMLNNSPIFSFFDSICEGLEDTRARIFEPSQANPPRFTPPAFKPESKSTRESTPANHTTPPTPKPQIPPKQHTPDIPTTSLTPSDSVASRHFTQNTPEAFLATQNIESTPNAQAPQTQNPNISPKPTHDPINKHKNRKSQKIIVEEGSSVLLIGDSMMQGTAPYALKIFKKVNVQGINLSKHSTGLTYKSYFDWASTTKEAFARNPNISLVVVLLGVNDPWVMQKTINFKTPEWENIYTHRIEEIINIARDYGARVAWYEIPAIKSKSLNEKVIYLNGLYEQQIRKWGEYFLPSNDVITEDNQYSAFIKSKDGKSVQVRDDDGVHFTARGYQIMANILLNAIEIRPKQKTKGESSQAPQNLSPAHPTQYTQGYK